MARREFLILTCGIARQYWWAWIETLRRSRVALRDFASPASIGGRGLKLHLGDEGDALVRIARQYWWAWIETAVTSGGKMPACPHRPPVLVGVD